MAPYGSSSRRLICWPGRLLVAAAMGRSSVLTLTKSAAIPTNVLRERGHRSRLMLLAWLVLLLTVSGCSEPSVRELKNRRELEALLTAISLRNQKELDRDIQRI